MTEYAPEEGSLSAALLAEVANGQARDLRSAHTEVAALKAENERLRAELARVLLLEPSPLWPPSPAPDAS